MPSDYDILVAGGGPAGLSAARAASENGAEVLLLELQAHLGQVQASAWVPPDLLKGDLSKAVTNEITSVIFHSEHRELEIEGNFGEIVDRRILEKRMGFCAVKEGVEIWVGAPVRSLLDGGKGVFGVRSEAGEWSEEIESDLVIDATGSGAKWASVFLREVLDSDWNKNRLNQTSEYLMANVSQGGKVDLYFSSMLAPMGYAWIYPLGDDFAVTGIRGERIHPDSALDEFIGRKEPASLDKSVPIGAYRGQLPMDGPLNSTVADGILSVGCSAGQVYPLSGHGMRYALTAGEIAGRVAAGGVKEGEVSKERLMEYDKLWRNKFEKDIEVGCMLRDSLGTSSDRKMDALLDFLDENPELREDFLRLFLGENIEKSLKRLFAFEQCRNIFGRKITDKILALYS